MKKVRTATLDRPRASRSESRQDFRHYNHAETVGEFRYQVAILANQAFRPEDETDRELSSIAIDRHVCKFASSECWRGRAFLERAASRRRRLADAWRSYAARCAG